MMSQRVALYGKVKEKNSEAEVKASVKSANESYGADTKPSDLSMARLKQG
jgi:hypothetical protein